jgi:hypothetical protein
MEGFMIQDPLMKIIPSPRNGEANQELIELLEILGNFRSGYPPELLKIRRAAFIAQVGQKRQSDSQVIQKIAK